MKKLTLAIVSTLLIISASDASAKGYSGSRSYSSRSYSRPPIVHNNNTTIIHHDSGPGLGTGLFMGYM